MAKINTSSLETKFKKYISGNKFKKTIAAKEFPSDIDYLEQVAMRLRMVYQYETDNLNEGVLDAIGALSTWVIDRKMSNGEYIILGYIDQNARTSLVPERYEGIDDMAALFNKGYTAGHQVFGIWHGQRVGSRVARQGLHFVEQTISDFNGNYGSEYNAFARLTPEGKERFT